MSHNKLTKGDKLQCIDADDLGVKPCSINKGSVYTFDGYGNPFTGKDDDLIYLQEVPAKMSGWRESFFITRFVLVDDRGSSSQRRVYDNKETRTKDTNPKSRAATNRLDLSIVPSTLIIFAAWALTEGDFKYGAYNFRKDGVSASTYKASVGRHIEKWYNGQDRDTKTRVHHLANAVAGLAILIDGIVKGNLNDDRPPFVDIDALLDDMEGEVAHLREMFPNPPDRVTERGLQSKTKPVESIVVEGLKENDRVLVYDRYRFGIPLLADIKRFSDTLGGVEVELLQSNNPKYPIGARVWVDMNQVSTNGVIRASRIGMKAGIHPEDEVL